MRGFLLIVTVMAGVALTPTASAQSLPQLSGTLSTLVAELTSPSYLLRAPANDPRPYADPTDALRDARRAAAAMAIDDLQAAAQAAAHFGYELIDFYDVETHRTYYLLRENLAQVGEPRGWGSYLFNPAPTINAVIEAPHPLGDEHSAEVAAQVLATGARGLLIAGAHRRKADLPDFVTSVFHQVHLAWSGGNFGGSRVPAVQIHGYGDFRHDFPDRAEVILSTGGGQVTDTLAALDAAFDAGGFPSYVFNRLVPTAPRNRLVNGDEAGPRFWSLAATKNEQGKQARGAGGEFVHIELEYAIRNDVDRRRQAGALIATTLAKQLPLAPAPADDTLPPTIESPTTETLVADTPAKPTDVSL